jgi:hypothetical protein
MFDDDYLTCLECGEEIEPELYDLHMEQMHGDENFQDTSRARERLQAKKEREGLGLKIAAGAVIVVIIVISFFLFFLPPADNGPEDIQNFQETEEQPEVVNIPNNDDQQNDNSGSGNDGSGTNNNGDNSTNDDNNGTVDDPEPVIQVVRIPTDDVTTNAKWYPYDSDGLEIRFFCVRSNDGEIHVAFDACDVCYDAKMGYRQGGIKMVCNNCDKSYPIRAIGTENQAGGCWPSYLPMNIEDEHIIIKVLDLEEKRYMFE